MTAATAASVGVNQPIVMPPIRITGAISAITAEKLKYQSSASSTTKAEPAARLTDMPALVSNHTVIGRASTTRISRPAEPRRPQWNGVSAPHLFLRAK